MPKVFLIDTEPHISALLTSRFEQEGFEVLPLGFSQVSSEALMQPPDLVVFGRGYREDDPTISSFQDLMKLGGADLVPIILLTASDTESLGDAPQKTIAQMKMPFRPSQLLELARKAVASA